MAPVEITLSTNGRPSKYLKSTANGLSGAGHMHSFTTSAMMSHSLVSGFTKKLILITVLLIMVNKIRLKNFIIESETLLFKPLFDVAAEKKYIITINQSIKINTKTVLKLNKSPNIIGMQRTKCTVTIALYMHCKLLTLHDKIAVYN